MAESVPTVERQSLPSGTVTFLFSDIEGSTQRWESHRLAMQDAVRRHDALLRSAIELRGGYVFKTVGDAFYGVFARLRKLLPPQSKCSAPSQHKTGERLTGCTCVRRFTPATRTSAKATISARR